ncbi:ATP citrate synthase [Candidatus Wirthbacteria bacterium CG2_30_54_11]|uniref:ATP citrate synthase n=1 Tax=Candidatus Wirthbacteria bacterium CG2_30_54_11 TaxID=1817892 RepID=A0A1J5IN49_9BACT|nr:MAG: ATP citrate synthase [Candidatus Wirthbacteria bacterium CG2_30_54_11]
MIRPDYLLFDRTSQAIINNFPKKAVQRMLDFDHVAGRELPSVACIVYPSSVGLEKFFFGSAEILIPVVKTIAEATDQFPDADVFIDFASYRSAYYSAREALENEHIRTVVIIAEGIAERRTRELIKLAHDRDKWLIGPSTVGGVSAGAFRIGDSGGAMECMIASQLHRPGHVGLVTKSGGLSSECYNLIANHTDGIFEGIAIGGDLYPGSSFADHLSRMNRNPEIKMLVCLGEVGGSGEYEIIEAIKDGRITKPVVAWVTGSCASLFTTEVQFGHAGAKSGVESESSQAKNAAMKAAGVIVPHSFDDFGDRIKEVFDELKAEGNIPDVVDIAPHELPEEFAKMTKAGKVRRASSIVCTISDDRGEEATYNKIPISQFVSESKGIGSVIGHLWFKKELPAEISGFIEKVLVLTADHGPAVSGAHNAIVTARAGKDLISSLVSGLLTIGPRFGGALDEAAQYFADALDRGISPEVFIKEMKDKGIPIPGIGHRIKSTKNPDTRVTLVKEYAAKHFKKTPTLNYALQVEQLTTAKKSNLILNVDGVIAACFVDILRYSGVFTPAEANEYIEIGILNGLFALGRSIGLIGHILDQKRLKQGLYRHAWDDIAYI